ncbi:MAG: rod shape-determining protein MreC [Patescibacteria group bacterium]
MKISRRGGLGTLVLLIGLGAGHAIGALTIIERPLAIAVRSGADALHAGVVFARERFFAPNDTTVLGERIVRLERDLAACTLRIADDAARATLASAESSLGQPSVLARIIGTSPDAEHSFILIDRGSEHGIERGDAVIADQAAYVGKVAEVTAFTSTVILPTDRRSKVIATFAREQPSRGVVEGQFQVGLRMNLIPITEKLERDQLVVTSGLESSIPAGLVIGRVRDIQSKPTDLFKSASLEPAVDYNRLRLVSVVIHQRNEAAQKK